MKTLFFTWLAFVLMLAELAFAVVFSFAGDTGNAIQHWGGFLLWASLWVLWGNMGRR
jgi:hypothetical protein